MYSKVNTLVYLTKKCSDHNILGEYKRFIGFTGVARSIIEVPLKLSGDFVFIILK